MTDAEKQAILDAIRAAESGIRSRYTDAQELAEKMYEIEDLLGDVHVNEETDGLVLPTA